MTSPELSLAAEITRCPILAATLEGAATPCRRVVSCLGDEPGPRYLPEAWNGHLAAARILFISSNPGAGDPTDPVLPELWVTSDSPDEEVFRSTDGAFDDGAAPGIVDGTRLVDRKGVRHGRPVRYWIWAKRMAAELLDRPVEPGIDYALTEVVHCGSKREKGVKQALATCSSLYLARIVALSPAVVLVAVGDKARNALKQQLEVPFEGREWGPGELMGSRRWVLTLPHPNSRGNRWGLEHYIQTDTLYELREALKFTSSSERIT